ncbi:hypothetical protein E2C01_051879 [Portunus trituberculatus]|uniref:Uncharacterized protein n=1 Tax=Portunus trituberculatus TaxID=210409 RepID=A0A5B7GJZ4_PORTR|nr:hypothetical protein [Portunus trituberculatus]
MLPRKSATHDTREWDGRGAGGEREGDVPEARGEAAALAGSFRWARLPRRRLDQSGAAQALLFTLRDYSVPRKLASRSRPLFLP